MGGEPARRAANSPLDIPALVAEQFLGLHDRVEAVISPVRHDRSARNICRVVGHQEGNNTRYIGWSSKTSERRVFNGHLRQLGPHVGVYPARSDRVDTDARPQVEGQTLGHTDQSRFARRISHGVDPTQKCVGTGNVDDGRRVAELTSQCLGESQCALDIDIQDPLPQGRVENAKFLELINAGVVNQREDLLPSKRRDERVDGIDAAGIQLRYGQTGNFPRQLLDAFLAAMIRAHHTVPVGQQPAGDSGTDASRRPGDNYGSVGW